MGFFSLAGSFWGPLGTAAGGLVDWLTSGSSSSAKKPAPSQIGFMPLQGLTQGEEQDPYQRPTTAQELPTPMDADVYAKALIPNASDTLLRLPEGMTLDEYRRQGMRPIPNYDTASVNVPTPLWGSNPLLDGRGGGGKTSTTPTTPGTQINQYANQQGGMNTAGLEGMANVVLGKAMSGQMNTTPYQVASQNLVQATNRTGQQTTQTLMSNLAQRGLANSGLQARGIAEIGANTAQAKAQGLAQISAQQAEAQNQQVQWAAQTAIDASLRAQQLALQARSLGIQQDQIDQQAQSNLFNMLGGLGSAIGGSDWMSGDNSWLGGLFGGGGGAIQQPSMPSLTDMVGGGWGNY